MTCCLHPQFEVLVASSDCATGFAFYRTRCVSCGAIQDELDYPGVRPLAGYITPVSDVVLV